MKTLLVLRHAKSSWKEPHLEDHDRPLNRRGERDAPRMGRLLAQKKMLPDRIVSSTAVRARTTAETVAEASGSDPALRLDPRLYLAPPADCVEVVREAPETCNALMIVGHNPGFEELVELLTGEEARFPTAALARISLPLERWADLTIESRGELVGLWIPKELSD